MLKSTIIHSLASHLLKILMIQGALNGVFDKQENRNR